MAQQLPGQSPFPIELPNGQVVIDEECYCGLKRSQHAHLPVGWGHGGTANCQKFSWKKFIFMDN